MEEEKKEFITIGLYYGETFQGSYCEPLEQALDILKSSESVENLNEGNSIRLTKVLMTQSEYDALPEFMGF